MSTGAILPPRRSRRKTAIAILGMGTASPPTLTQEQIASVNIDMACRGPEERAWLQRVYLRSGIQRRGVVLAGDARGDSDEKVAALRSFYRANANPGTAERMARYAIEAPILAAEASGLALADARIKPSAITHLITVSCTGFFAPGLDAALIGELGLSPSLRRLHVGFMGCHGAFNALAAARDAVLADRDARVLVCSVELCSLHMAYGWDAGRLVSNALFGDGAAAAVLGRRQLSGGVWSGANAHWHLQDTASMLLRDSLDAMTWTIGDHGFEMTLSPAVPDVIRQNLRPWCEQWLGRNDLRLEDIASWAIHPGGPKILSAVAETLGLEAEALRYSREILAEQGNISSATVLFILKRMAEDAPRGPCVAIGLGPGLMAEGMLLRR